MKSFNIVFMGTPAYAVPTLEALVSQYTVVGVVTQPDRRSGRGQKLAFSAVKKAAMAHDLTLFQPRTLHTPQAVAQVASWQPDVIVVAAFGQILRQDVLDLPPHGCLNVHASLLPRWRGAAPVAAAILAGDQKTGVTIMKMDAGLDTGPIISQRAVAIRPDDTRATLTHRLAKAGAELLAETLPTYLAGDVTPHAQTEQAASYAPQLRRADGEIEWRNSAVQLDRKIRAFTPWPGTFTQLNGQRFKILQATPLPQWRGDAPPGTIVALEDECAVTTGEGALRIEQVQMAGKRPMEIDAFLCGHRECIGVCLGEET